MPKAFVFNEKLSATDRSRVENLLQLAGFEPVFGSGIAVGAANLSVDIGVVCLPIDASEEDAVTKRIKDFTMAGARVVAIWLNEEAEEEELPLGLRALGSGAVAIGSPKATAMLKGEDVVWQNPKGKTRKAPTLKRNC